MRNIGRAVEKVVYAVASICSNRGTSIGSSERLTVDWEVSCRQVTLRRCYTHDLADITEEGTRFAYLDRFIETAARRVDEFL